MDWTEKMQKMAEVVKLSTPAMMEQADKVAKGYIRTHPSTGELSAEKALATGIIAGRIFERIGEEAWATAVRLGESQ